MTISKIVKFCLTKMAILFPCAGAQVYLGSGKRHFSVEWTQNPEMSRKCLLSCPVEAGVGRGGGSGHSWGLKTKSG